MSTSLERSPYFDELAMLIEWLDADLNLEASHRPSGNTRDKLLKLREYACALLEIMPEASSAFLFHTVGRSSR